ncbi:XRE family transcriptional regulator [Actinomadura yumaensis]|uniref:XRE family transcriptional regulator n=1 Tax=Actinomadura yumaensis TaxID=111807 RepID=A0ABW2CNL8_9ACTN
MPEIAARIRRDLPEVRALEAWRWAYGWSRAAAIEQIVQYYRERDLGVPGLNTSMLCRYEHGELRPGADYATAFCGVYRAAPADLGLEGSFPAWAVRAEADGYGPWGMVATARMGHQMANGNGEALEALRDTITLGLEVEGPAGGPQTRESLQAAVEHYALNYSAWPPGTLAGEVHQVRHLVNQMLAQRPPEPDRAELRRIAGWLSALVGNLAFHLADEDLAMVHWGTAARLGAEVGDRWLECWTLGARAMVAHHQDRHEQATAFGQRAFELADTPLRRAQMLAWAMIRPTAARGTQYRGEVTRIAARAQEEMAAAPAELPGRFGFDRAEFTLHLAEAHLLVGDDATGRRHAEDSLGHIPHGRPGWAAAQLVLARAEAARGRAADAAALAGEVLDTIPPDALRSNSRKRLTVLAGELAGVPAPAVAELRERAAELPALVPVTRPSAEPNGS